MTHAPKGLGERGKGVKGREKGRERICRQEGGRGRVIQADLYEMHRFLDSLFRQFEK